MNKKIAFVKKTAAAVIALAVFMSLLTFGASDDYSTENDPLVSLSYINGVLTPNFEKYVDDKVKNVSVEEIVSSLMNSEDFRQYVSSVVASLAQSGSSGSSSSAEFMTLQLAAGRKIISHGKCEIIVRSGQAAAVSVTDGAVKDLSSGKTLKNGDPVAIGSFIEISYADGSGIAALRTTTEVLVRGDFTVGE